MTDQIKKVMELLGCDETAAAQVIADDERIDKGEKLFEQTAEQKAVSKKYRQGDRKPTVYNFQKRERKADVSKQELIKKIAAAVGKVADTELTITNAERQIDFVYKGRKFRVVLSAPRS